MKLSRISKHYIGAIFILLAANSFATQDMIVAKDGKAEDYFGYSAAIDGNTLLVGAYKADINQIMDAGAAYVYVLNDNAWHQQAKLVAAPFFAEDTTGGNVALNNDIAVLGVIGRDDKGKDAGAVIVFERHGDSWQQTQIITAPDAKPGDAFGQSISLTENHLVIGAPRSDAMGENSGAAYIYKRESDAWQYQTKIKASDGAAGDLFGISIAIDGETIVVGADLHDEKAENAGAVYVYVLDHDNKWIQEAKLIADDAGDTDIFGVRVAISGNVALVSARRDDVEGIGIDAGSAYIFERNGRKWTQKVKLTSPDGQADDRFGRGVALSGDKAIISAMNHDAKGIDTGAVYVYEKVSGNWQFTSKITANKSFANDRFGWNIGLSGNKAVIVSPNHDAKGENSGAVFVKQLKSATQKQ
ncbi:FG-GAP repeat protein [Planctobacterium marinum]|uniref:PKD domain-containing protein n=1 Tax=Planctobacterium marinum TaxID=1631968 RepID=A0AA48HK17_9ALTE|nr:hypothetical protein MACH26_16970 [Planctobacterium marinum]